MNRLCPLDFENGVLVAMLRDGVDRVLRRRVVVKSDECEALQKDTIDLA